MPTQSAADEPTERTAPSASPNAAVVDDVARFFANWSMYRAVIENDCMDHARIYREVGALLRERRRAFTLMDLGCGDAAGVGPSLRGTAITRFVGVDNAAPALEFARGTLADAAFEVELVEQNLTEAVRSDRTYDVVVMAFALHHFQSAEKRGIIADIRRRLQPGGELVLIDLVRQPGQSRQDYLEDYIEYVRSWPLAEETIGAIIDHVTGFDFPEDVDAQPRWALEAGYADVVEFYAGGADLRGHDTQRGWRFLT